MGRSRTDVIDIKAPRPEKGDAYVTSGAVGGD